MKISTRSRYGMRLMLELALKHGKGPMFLKDISSRQDVSEKYLGQIIIPLKARGLVNAFRGSHGGYTLSREPGKITLREIVEVLENGMNIVECVRNPSVCKRSETCITQGVWTKVEKAILETLEGITLADLVREQGVKAGSALTWSI
jgi:Rrf2 family protein